MKGHPQSIGGGGGGGGGTGGLMMMNMKIKKMMVVAVVVLVAVMGLTVVQKLRDRRLYNLVIKDKDRQILSLHLLLQKERQYAKETKRKNQDLNAKLFSLRTQKMELNNKVLEMRSTITSLRDEQHALELAIEQKESEINSLRTPPVKVWSKVNVTAVVGQRNSTFGVEQRANNGEESSRETEVEEPRDGNGKEKVSSTKEGDVETRNVNDGRGVNRLGELRETDDGNRLKAEWKETSANQTVDSGGTRAEADTETDNAKTSMESGHGSEADEDDKEEADE